jgi:putative acetyltransferase
MVLFLGEKIIFTCLVLFFAIDECAIKISSIKPEECQAAKELVVDTAYEVFQLTIDKNQFLQELDAADEFYDIENMQEVYLNNNGLFLVLIDDQKIVGTGALKKLDDSTAELKRMWFLKEYRGKGYALKMVNQLLSFARLQGYTKIRLDVWSPQNQQQAIAFYRKIGFYEIERYNRSPAKFFMEMILGINCEN